MAKINVSMINNIPYIFNADDYMTLRTKHKIIGNIIGIPVHQPRNLKLNGLPAILSIYELKLLMEKNVVMVLDKMGLKTAPLPDQLEKYKIMKNNQLEPQQENYVQQRLEKSKQIVGKIIQGKRKKLLKSGVPESEINLTEESVLEEEASRIKETIAGNLLVQIPTEHPVEVETKVLTQSDLPQIDEVKFKVFKDLWSRGKFITNGDIFGCDFLVYPGDPLFYHATHKIHIIKKDEKFDLKSLITNARLSITVNKHCTYVFVNSEGSLEYHTVSWINMEK